MKDKSEKIIDAKVILSLFNLVLRNEDNTKLFVLIYNKKNGTYLMSSFTLEDKVITSSPLGYNKYLNGYRINNIEDIDVSKQITVKNFV